MSGRRMSRQCLCAFVVVWGISQGAGANMALYQVTGSPYEVPAAGSNHGWEFVANSPITVSSLGLYDFRGDGFATDFPIGLFRVSDSALLTSGTIHAGTVDPLLDEFRYVATPEVTLVPGARYVVSFFSSEDAFGDVMFGEAGTPTAASVDPALTYVQARWGWPEAAFGLPENPTAWRIGPNFLFRETTPALPIPGALLLAGLGACLAVRLRR